jgi:hypothetical protein
MPTVKKATYPPLCFTADSSCQIHMAHRSRRSGVPAMTARNLLCHPPTWASRDKTETSCRKIHWREVSCRPARTTYLSMDAMTVGFETTVRQCVPARTSRRSALSTVGQCQRQRKFRFHLPTIRNEWIIQSRYLRGGCSRHAMPFARPSCSLSD